MNIDMMISFTIYEKIGLNQNNRSNQNKAEIYHIKRGTNKVTDIAAEYNVIRTTGEKKEIKIRTKLIWGSIPQTSLNI